MTKARASPKPTPAPALADQVEPATEERGRAEQLRRAGTEHLAASPHSRRNDSSSPIEKSRRFPNSAKGSDRVQVGDRQIREPDGGGEARRSRAGRRTSPPG